MTMNVDQEVLDRLWGPELKIISAAVDAQAVSEALGAEALNPGVTQVVFQPAADGEQAGLRPATCLRPKWTTMKTPPTGPCLLVIASDAGGADLEGLRAWWAQYGSEPDLPVLDLRGALANRANDRSSASAVLYQQLFQLAWDEAHRSAQRQAQLQSEIYELRREYGLVRLSAQDLRERLERLGHGTPEIIHLMPETNATFRPTGAESPRLRQKLPISAEGFAGMDLCSPETADRKPGEGHLAISLHARDSDTVLASWHVAYSTLGRGWFRCVAQQAMASREQHVDLEIRWQTVRGEPPALALSPVGAFPELAAVMNDQPLSHAVSIVVWGALPGSRLLSSAGICSCDGAKTGGVIEYRLDRPTIARIQAGTVAQFPYLHPLPDVPGFRLHPLDHTLATALLPHACLPGTDRVSAIAEIRMPEAKYPVEYAMCLTYAAAGCRGFPRKPKTDSQVLGFSGWHVVPADGQPHAIVLELLRPLPCVADLHFATRMLDGRPMTNHWADWLEVRIRVQGGTVVGAAQPAES
jgi:hypothetical protein